MGGGVQLELAQQGGVDLAALEPLQLPPMAVAASRDLVGDIAQLDQGGLVLLLGHESARALDTRQCLFVAELAQGTVDGHARHIELLDQRGLAGNGLAFLPYATVDLLQHMVFDALERRYGGGGIGSRHRVCLD
ncbi:hypothetical protein SDC9_152967 [bioreactor metagenome]|uniref:Uncharacterized protein n=1 Tax=bioreactor metagenome TaxID=1076179 RepID=A0A645EZ90_9ZZZZ